MSVDLKMKEKTFIKVLQAVDSWSAVLASQCSYYFLCFQLNIDPSPNFVLAGEQDTVQLCHGLPPLGQEGGCSTVSSAASSPDA